VQQKER